MPRINIIDLNEYPFSSKDANVFNCCLGSLMEQQFLKEKTNHIATHKNFSVDYKKHSHTIQVNHPIYFVNLEKMDESHIKLLITLIQQKIIERRPEDSRLQLLPTTLYRIIDKTNNTPLFLALSHEICAQPLPNGENEFFVLSENAIAISQKNRQAQQKTANEIAQAQADYPNIQQRHFVTKESLGLASVQLDRTDIDEEGDKTFLNLNYLEKDILTAVYYSPFSFIIKNDQLIFNHQKRTIRIKRNTFTEDQPQAIADFKEGSQTQQQLSEYLEEKPEIANRKAVILKNANTYEARTVAPFVEGNVVNPHSFKNLSYGEALTLSTELLATLLDFQQKNQKKVHSDLHPKNILYRPQSFKIIDYDQVVSEGSFRDISGNPKYNPHFKLLTTIEEIRAKIILSLSEKNERKKKSHLKTAQVWWENFHKDLAHFPHCKLKLERQAQVSANSCFFDAVENLKFKYSLDNLNDYLKNERNSDLLKNAWEQYLQNYRNFITKESVSAEELNTFKQKTEELNQTITQHNLKKRGKNPAKIIELPKLTKINSPETALDFANLSEQDRIRLLAALKPNHSSLTLQEQLTQKHDLYAVGITLKTLYDKSQYKPEEDKLHDDFAPHRAVETFLSANKILDKKLTQQPTAAQALAVFCRALVVQLQTDLHKIESAISKNRALLQDAQKKFIAEEKLPESKEKIFIHPKGHAYEILLEKLKTQAEAVSALQKQITSLIHKKISEIKEPEQAKLYHEDVKKIREQYDHLYVQIAGIFSAQDIKKLQGHRIGLLNGITRPISLLFGGILKLCRGQSDWYDYGFWKSTSATNLQNLRRDLSKIASESHMFEKDRNAVVFKMNAL
jgi:hypothetical protein